MFAGERGSLGLGRDPHTRGFAAGRRLTWTRGADGRLN